MQNVRRQNVVERHVGYAGVLACTGSLPISLNASKLAEMTEKNITDLRSKLKEADAKARQKHTSTLLLYHFNAYTL